MKNSEAVAAYRKRNPEKVREWNRNYYRKNRLSSKPYRPRVSKWNPHRYVDEDTFYDNWHRLTAEYLKVTGKVPVDKLKKWNYYMFRVEDDIQADIEAYDDWDRQAQGKFINDKKEYKGIA